MGKNLYVFVDNSNSGDKMPIDLRRLKKLRVDNGYTQKQVADYLEIDQSYLSKIEKGERKITLSIINRLCLLYDCSHQYLFDKDDGYQLPKIAFKGVNNVDLDAIARMNEVKMYLNQLRHIEGEILNE